MNITVCIRRLANGELNPFDACAYEAALRIKDAEVTLLSMGPESVKDFLLGLTRLGAKRGILLSDKAFAGADTLATSYTLSLALKMLSPDLIFCGRQTIDGDTGQVGPELAEMLNVDLITNVMKLESRNGEVIYETRNGDSGSLPVPSLITVERIHALRLPSIRSKVGTVEVWNSETLSADNKRCGLAGSPTRVMATFKNEQDRRKCKFISPDQLQNTIENALNAPRIETPKSEGSPKLKNIWIIGESPREMAESVSDSITVVPLGSVDALVDKIKAQDPEFILWGSDSESKKIAARVAARLKTGLCADCTLLESDGDELYMYRPAFSGDIIAKIKCLTRPKMATVRTLSENKDRITVGLGFGVKNCIDQATSFAKKLGASTVCSRKLVDHDFMPYEKQVGLTGKSLNPDVYIAIGISGAVHHIAGIKQSGTIIAVNPDKDADIFKYSDYGIVSNAEDIF